MQREILFPSSLLTALSRVYSLLLFAYPTRFRQEYGKWIAQLFRDQLRAQLQERNHAALIRFLWRTLFDLARTAFIEQVAELFNIHLEGETMSYHETVHELAENPEALEELYNDAVKKGNTFPFQQAIDANYQNAPHNLLLAGWYHRLHYAARQAAAAIIEWRWVIPLAALNGLLFWWFADDSRYMVQIAGGPSVPRSFLPAIFLWAAPLTALFILVYFTQAGRQKWSLTAAAALPLGAAAYIFFTYSQVGIRPFQEQYLTLMLLHLPLLAWVGVGAYLLANHRDDASRRQFLLKSIEVLVVGGIAAAALVLFLAITVSLFDALDVLIPDAVMRFLFGGGVGTLAVIIPAIIYNPRRSPGEQTVAHNLTRLLAVMMQVLLPATFLVLLVYIGFIPAHFRAPFDNRDVLITYNVMLFAVVALLVGATMLRSADNSPRQDRWLRRLIIGVAVLTLIVSLYALSAAIFRTVNDRLTPNRLTIIGWNIVNIGLLILLLLLQWRFRAGEWLAGLYRAFSLGTAVYAAWAIIVVLALPWFFRVNQGDITSLPISVRQVVFDQPTPVLLKCAGSDHIYLLDRGEKRWIEDIDTFESRGYVWRDVHLVPCFDLRRVPDGIPIPPTAGPPPQP